MNQYAGTPLPGRSLIEQRLVALASDRAETYKGAYAWFLGQGPGIAPALIKALEDDSLGSLCRWRILLLLRHFALPETLPAILAVLRSAASRRDAILLPGAMEAVAVFRNAEANQALIDLLKYPDPDTVKHAAVLAGRTGDSKALEPLLRLLSDASASMRYSAAKGLIALGGPEVKDALNRHLDSETDPEVRALVRSGGAGGPPPR